MACYVPDPESNAYEIPKNKIIGEKYLVSNVAKLLLYTFLKKPTYLKSPMDLTTKTKDTKKPR
jgi:hypothetical protein